MVTGPGPEGIFLPAGTIHATYTIEGGFLCGITCATANAITVVTKCVSLELARSGEKGTPGDKPGAMNVYDRSLECVFKSSKIELIDKAMSAWIRHQDQFLKHPGLIKETKQLWLENLPRGGRRCPCGHQSDLFLDHWINAHLTSDESRNKRAPDNSAHSSTSRVKKQKVSRRHPL